MSRTGTAAQLFGHVEQAQLSLHPDELTSRRLREGQLVRVKSRRGELILPVAADDQVRPGQAFIPMHWGDRFLKGLGVNVLTQPAFDPISKQPELKQAGINVQPVELPWELFVLVEGDVQKRFAELRPLCEGLIFASLALTGRERPALVIRAAHNKAPEPELLSRIDSILGLDQGPVLVYDDPRRSVGKRVKIEDGRITAIRLTGETAVRDWLRSVWESGETDAALRRWFLAPLSAPPGGSAATDKTICNCMNVKASCIRDGIEQGLDLDELKEQLGCGTQCGSCVPEIRRMLTTTEVPA